MTACSKLKKEVEAEKEAQIDSQKETIRNLLEANEKLSKNCSKVLEQHSQLSEKVGSSFSLLLFPIF